MKITCTQKEKEMLIESIVKSPLCSFPESKHCYVEICDSTQCAKCMNETIEWKIEDGEQDD